MSEQKCICGDVISEDKLEEFSSEELQALNNLLEGNCTQKEIEVLTRFITDAPKVQGVSDDERKKTTI